MEKPKAHVLWSGWCSSGVLSQKVKQNRFLLVFRMFWGGDLEGVTLHSTEHRRVNDVNDGEGASTLARQSSWRPRSHHLIL